MTHYTYTCILLHLLIKTHNPFFRTSLFLSVSPTREHGCIAFPFLSSLPSSPHCLSASLCTVWTMPAEAARRTTLPPPMACGTLRPTCRGWTLWSRRWSGLLPLSTRHCARPFRSCCSRPHSHHAYSDCKWCQVYTDRCCTLYE